MSQNINITFEVRIPTDNKLKTVPGPVTFYSIDALYPGDFGNAVIVSGGKEWHATSTYAEIWEKLKKHIDESNSRK
jgi:hypothetical protein